MCESVCMSPVCFTILVLSVSPAATTTHRTDRPTTIRPAAEQSRARVAQRPKRARRVIQQFSIVCVCVGSGRVSKIVRSFAAPRFRSVPPSLLSQPASHSVSVWFGGVVRLCSAFRVAPLFFLKYNIGVVCVLLLLFAFLLRSSSCSASKPNATPLTVHDTGRLVGTLSAMFLRRPLVHRRCVVVVWCFVLLLVKLRERTTKTERFEPINNSTPHMHMCVFLYYTYIAAVYFKHITLIWTLL